MINLFIKPLNSLICINEGITNVCFQDNICYRNFLMNFIDEVICSINNTTININTSALIIYDPINIELNDKKTLTQLYKKLSHRVSEQIKQKICIVEKEIFELLELISNESSFLIEYEDSFELVKVLQMYQVSLQEVKKENYLEFIVTYIKTNFELNNYSIVISFGLTPLLTKTELSVLKTELAINQISIVDFYYESSSPIISNLTIDSDWNKI